jgi:hypothetical protein
MKKSSDSTSERVLYVDPEGRQHRALLVWWPMQAGHPAKLVIRRGARVEVVDAKYSPRREPGTWSRVLEPAS